MPFPEKYLYLVINALTILFPLLWSFEKRIHYVKGFKSLFSAIFLTMCLFIPWDILFTHWGVWGFNERYLSGFPLFGLPLGEWLFFVTVPFSCVFIYESVRYFIKWHPSPIWTIRISNFLIAFFLIGALVFYSNLYTATTFVLCLVFVLLSQYYFKFPFLGRIYFSYLFVLIPFFIVNGILTGFGIEEQVVWYNGEEFMGIRMATIPVEDTFYGFLLIALTTTLYLRLEGRKD